MFFKIIIALLSFLPCPTVYGIMTHEKDILVQNQPSVKRRVVNERLTRYFTFTDGFLGVTQRQIAFERLSAVAILCGIPRHGSFSHPNENNHAHHNERGTLLIQTDFL